MAPIPGWGYVLAGAVISGVSKIIEKSSNQPGKFKFFFFIGILFIIIGVGKIGYKILLGNLTGSGNKQNMSRQGFNSHSAQARSQAQGHNPHHTHSSYPGHYQQGSQSHTSSMIQQNFQRGEHHIQREKPIYDHPSVLHCPACGIKHYSYANFCMMCGARMRRK